MSVHDSRHVLRGQHLRQGAVFRLQRGLVAEHDLVQLPPQHCVVFGDRCIRHFYGGRCFGARPQARQLSLGGSRCGRPGLQLPLQLLRITGSSDKTT
jgi:hypothetical protein